MFVERKRLGVLPRALTSDGSANGLVQVADITGFYVKQKVSIKSNTQPSQLFEIKRFDSLTSFYVGPLPPQGGIEKRSNISAYLVADGAVISAEEQDRPGIKPDEHERAVYAEEPIVAKRTIQVDQFGRYYTVDNPMPVQLSDGSVNIGTVNAELEVQLSHKSDSPDPGDIADRINTIDGFLDRRVENINNITYEGFAEAGSATSDAAWRITRKVHQPDGSVVELVVGDLTYDQIWDDRASLFPAVTPIDFWERRFERLLPILSNANWLKLGNFDQVIPTFTDAYIQMNYYEDGANIGRATVRYINDLDWQIDLLRFINDDDGSLLLDDDDSYLLLD